MHVTWTSGTLELRNNIFENNRANNNGGAIDSWANASTIFTGNTFLNNRSTNGNGGAVMLWQYSGPITLDHNTITDNYARLNGGGLYVYNSTVTITNNIISRNTADQQAGGVMINSCQATVTDNTITDNDARWDGGGLYVYLSTLAITNHNDISRNTSDQQAGGIMINSCQATVSDNTITDNYARWDGGGVYLYNCPASMIIGNTVTGNTGDGILVNRAAAGRLESNTVSGNTGAGIALIDGFTNGVTLSRNRTYGNGGIGIDLNRDGVTLNDPGDADTGPNGLLNFPVLHLGSGAAAGYVRVAGTAGAGQRIEVFRAEGTSDYGEASAYLGSAMADAAGNFTLDVPAANFWVTATATDAAGQHLRAFHGPADGNRDTCISSIRPEDNLDVDGWLTLREAIYAANSDSPIGDAAGRARRRHHHVRSRLADR